VQIDESITSRWMPIAKAMQVDTVAVQVDDLTKKVDAMPKNLNK
jgi:hypothetical protein